MSNFYCPLPWMHLFFKPNGKVQACCESYDDIFDPGKTIQETANNPVLKQLRLDLLNPDVKPKLCHRCIERETYLDMSVRISSLKLHPDWHIDKARYVTKRDGSVDNFHLENIDIRWSNLRNYKCRFCSLASSNTWLKDQHKLRHIVEYDKDFRQYDSKTGIAEYDMDWNDLKKHLPYLKYVKLAGGEPTIMPGTYQLLEELVIVGNTNCQISMITNATTVKFGKKDLFGLLKNFPKTKITLSIDGIGLAHEWLRSGKSDWPDIEKNIELFKQHSKENGWRIIFHSGLSWMNLYNMGELILQYPDWEQVFNIVTHPPEMSIGRFYKHELIKAKKHYNKLIENTENKKAKNRLIIVARAIANGIHKTKEDVDMAMFKEVHGILDESRQQSFVKAFPEWNVYA